MEVHNNQDPHQFQSCEEKIKSTQNTLEVIKNNQKKTCEQIVHRECRDYEINNHHQHQEIPPVFTYIQGAL